MYVKASANQKMLFRYELQPSEASLNTPGCLAINRGTHYTWIYLDNSLLESTAVFTSQGLHQIYSELAVSFPSINRLLTSRRVSGRLCVYTTRWCFGEDCGCWGETHLILNCVYSFIFSAETEKRKKDKTSVPKGIKFGSLWTKSGKYSQTKEGIIWNESANPQLCSLPPEFEPSVGAGDHRKRVGLGQRGQWASRLTVSCRALLTAGNYNLF